MNAMMAPYPWQNDLWRSLTRIIQEQRCPHALLLQGSQGVGVESLALSLVPQLMCSDLQQGRHTLASSIFQGDAPSLDASTIDCACCRWVVCGTHPDVYVVPSEGTSIGVDEVREAIVFMNKTPSMPAGIKVIRLHGVDKLTSSAANALLKSTEEPSGHGIWLMTSSASSTLLQTLTSRCLSLNISASQEDTQTWLSKYPATDAQKARALGWAPHAPLLAQSFLDKELGAALGPLWNDLKSVMEGRMHVWSFASSWKDNFDEVFRLILLSLKETLLKASNPQAKLHAVTQSQRVLNVITLAKVPGAKPEKLIAMALLLIKETANG